MAYQALYRTYRPKNFSEVIGQEVIVKTLQNAIATNKTTHAYLFSGPRGTGKTTIARILAKALNCDNIVDKEPCCQCTSCKEIAEGISPDVIEIDGASNTGVDDIREIKDKVKFMPSNGKYKVYIIDEVHMLSQSAFNALLKTLEEPPKHVIFILATTEPQKVLPTILSRCQRYDFKALTVNEISGYIKRVAAEEKVKITDEAVIGLAECAEGAMRDALSFLDQAISVSENEITIEDVNNVTGNLSYNKTIELAGYLENKQIGLALKSINDLINLGKEVNKIVTTLLQFYRDVLLYKTIDTSLFERYIFKKEEFKNFVEVVDIEKVFYYVDVLSDIQTKIKFTNNPNIFLEVAIIKMVNVSNDDLNLIKKVKELEEKITEFTSGATSVPMNSTTTTTIDDERIMLIENKVNRVINELSKMELPKLIQKVNDLDKPSAADNSTEICEIKQNILSLQEAVQLLKVTTRQCDNDLDIDSIVNKTNQDINFDEIVSKVVSRIGSNQVDTEKIKEQITTIVIQQLSEVNNSENVDYSEIKDEIISVKDEINKQVIDKDELKKEILAEVNDNKPDVDSLTSIITDKINEIKKSLNFDNNQSLPEDIIYRIEYLEEDITKIRCELLAAQTISLKKPKRKANENQMVLFGNDVVRINDFDKATEKAKIDFGNLQKKADEEKPIISKPVEKKVEEDKNEIVKQILDEYTVQDSNVEMTSKMVKNEPDEVIQQKTLEPIVSPTIEPTVNPVIEKPKSQIVYTKKETKEPEVNYGLFTSERNNLVKELEQTKQKTIIEKAQPTVLSSRENKPLRYEDLDEFERYEVCVVERILTDSQANKKESKEALLRINEKWKDIDKKTPVEKQYITEVLAEGEVVVVGNGEIIIAFKNSAICNQVMRRPFRKEAINVIRDFLGTKYVYLALPMKIWRMKREEYVAAYFRGETQPKLAPIDDPTLNVGIEREVIKPEDELVDDVIRMFGSNLVETKRGE